MLCVATILFSSQSDLADSGIPEEYLAKLINLEKKVAELHPSLVIQACAYVGHNIKLLYPALCVDLSPLYPAIASDEASLLNCTLYTQIFTNYAVSIPQGHASIRNMFMQ